MKIEPLPTDVRSYLRSGVAITSVTQCIEELVLNSLDAGATCVAVRVDLNCFKVQVIDNGSGVPRDQLDILGNRFCTSKCHALADLDNLCHFGYRGEALASIRDSCGILEITTRSNLSNKTYCKIFQNGKSLKVAESTIVRPSMGTTMTIHELFTNFPVRQKSMNKNYEIERIKEMLEGIALIRSGISFTLRNDSTGQVILSTRKCSNIDSTFGQLYGTAKADMLAEVQGSKQVFKIHSYIGREGHPRKNLQFVYVNGRLVKKSKIHKLLNKLLLNLPALKPKQKMSSDSPKFPFNKQSVFMSPPKFSEVFPVYVLEVKCPVSEYDITFEPAKTMVEFRDWDALLACIEEVTKSFLSKENIQFDSDETKSGIEAVKATDVQNMPVISTDTMKGVLVSKTVKRVTVQKNTAVMLQTPDGRNPSFSSKPASGTEYQAESNTFKTPADKRIKVSKAAIGLGNRKIGRETDTDDSEATEIKDITKSSNISTSDCSTSTSDCTASTSDDCISSSDDSFAKERDKTKTLNKEFCEGNDKNKITQVPQSAVDHNHVSKQTTGNVSQSSLSRYRQYIGKFTVRTTGNINIDESLKKLNRIMPPASKPNSKTLFSSLQRFRRKTETATGKTKAIPDSNFNEEVSSRTNHIKDAKGQHPEAETKSAGNIPSETCRYNVIEGDKEYENRNIANQNEDYFQTLSGESLSAFAARDKDRSKSKCTSAEKQHSPNQKDLYEASISSQESVRQLKFSPCCEISENVNGLKDEQKSDVNKDRSAENEPFFDMDNCCYEITLEDQQHNVREIEKIDNLEIESQNIADPYSQIVQLPYLQACEEDMEYDDEFDLQCTRYNRKRQIHELEIPHEYEKHFKYMARPLDHAELETELKYKQDVCDTGNVCNKMSCDEISPKDNDDHNMHSCDRVADVDKGMASEGKEMNSDKVASCEKQFDVEIVNNRSDHSVINESNLDKKKMSDMKNKYVLNEFDKYIDSTQGFSPRLSPDLKESDETQVKNSEDVQTRTPESFGFTPKLQTDSQLNTPDSTGFTPGKDSENTAGPDKSKSDDEIKAACECIEGTDTMCQGFISENKVDINEVCSDINERKIMQRSGDRAVTDDKVNESVTLTQLLKTSSQATDSEKLDSFAEYEEIETAAQNSGLGGKGFSFADLFSQTPSCSMDKEAVTNSMILDVGDGNKIIDSSGNCFDCNLGVRENVASCSRKCTEKGDNLDSVVDMKGESNSAGDGKVEGSDEILWTDSPWDISDSSFYLKDEINRDRTVDSENDERIVDDSAFQGEIKNENSCMKDEDTVVKGSDDTETINNQDMNTLDSLDVWYKRLDAGVSVSSDILQSKKPSDVVKRLHACRFSKESLKSVKVLGQLDKKFIACLINTEEQSTDIDHTMLVLIDQHAAHERVRLEILTEEAFEHSVKGAQLAPLAVDPAHSMTFAENEVQTIMSFQDGFLKLGIRLRQDTPTTVLISSVPACLVDKEKNSKIYWSTVQVLIREHIAVFMSTQVSYGVLPQTIHKVLCSLACHGAIKFGDRLSTNECIKLIKDLSRCDLPFQCAHGRPSVMPLFHMDKLQSLSHSKRQAKPRLWKLKQALKLKQKMQP